MKKVGKRQPKQLYIKRVNELAESLKASYSQVKRLFRCKRSLGIINVII